MLKKFVGDKMSIEARSDDGRRWEIHLYDRGTLTKYSDATQADLDGLVLKRRMKPAANGRA